jgi:hypothetical protein
MKIAVVYDVIYPYVKGGVEKRVWDLAVRLACRGHEVHLYGMKFWDGEDIINHEGVFLHGSVALKNSIQAAGGLFYRLSILVSFSSSLY